MADKELIKAVSTITDKHSALSKVTDLGLSIGSVLFIVAFFADMYSQFKSTGCWAIPDWEITCLTASMGLRGIYQVAKK